MTLIDIESNHHDEADTHQNKTITAKILNMYDHLKIFSKPWAILFCLIITISTVVGTIRDLMINSADLVYALSYGTVQILFYVYLSSTPWITMNTYNKFLKPMKIIPSANSITSLSALIFCGIFNVAQTIIAAYFVATATADVVIWSVLWLLISILTTLSYPLPFLIIGSSTKLILISCSKVRSTGNIEEIQELLQQYKSLQALLSAPIFVTFVFQVLLLLFLAYFVITSIQGCNKIFSDLTWLILNLLGLVYPLVSLFYLGITLDDF